MMDYYLKVNLELGFSFRCLQFWIDTIQLYNIGRVTIICDKEYLKDKIIEKIHFYAAPKWITSAHIVLKKYVEGFYDKYWYGASYAHLTTFVNATEIQVERFWNIDADDTLFCITPEKMSLFFKDIENYAEDNNLDIFSFDMHDSRTMHTHFSYGISYVRSCGKILDLYKDINTKWRYYKKESQLCANVDWYATYLRDIGKINVKSFYCENVWFAHFGVIYNFELALHGLYHYSNGKVYLPLYESLNDGKMYFPIQKDVVKFDFEITDEENRNNVKKMFFCLEPSFDSFNSSLVIENDKSENDSTITI